MKAPRGKVSLPFTTQEICVCFPLGHDSFIREKILDIYVHILSFLRVLWVFHCKADISLCSR